MAKLSVDQALLKAKSHAKKGEIEKAQKLYQAVLQAFPKNKQAQQELVALNKHKQPAATQGPPQEAINQLINLYNQGQLGAVVEQAQALTEQYPEAFVVWNLLGAASAQTGKLAQAINALQRVIAIKPDSADAYNNMGNALQDLGELEEAIASYEKALSLKPDYVEACYNKGITLQGQGKLGEAIASYEKALSLKPDHIEVYNNIGNALQDQGKLYEAIASYEKALSLKPDYAEAHNNMGVALKDQGKFDEAIAPLQKALSLKPDYAEAHNNMGVALQSLGKLEEAIASYEKALSLKPDYVDAYYNKGNALQNQSKFEEAIACYNKALSLKPDYAEAHDNMGATFHKLGELEEAIAYYQKALSLKPDYAEAHNNMGVALKDQGKLEEAILSYSKALLLKPDYAGALRNLSSLIKYKHDDPQVAVVRELIQRSDLIEDDRCHLYFTYAKMNEDLGNLDVAFENYVAGGKLRQKLLSYDFKQDKRNFDQIKNTAPKLKKLAVNELIEAAPRTPIFILGMLRSGTTLVEQIISNHSQVHGAGELPFLGLFGSSLSLGNQMINSDNILQIRNAYLGELVKVSSGAPFVTDKMPHNFQNIALISKALPEAKVIHVKRDPAATCWSNFKHYFSAKGIGYSYDLKDTVGFFKLYQDLMDFWDQQYSDQIYHLDYDTLTVDQDFETRKLIEYLELGWEDACLYPQDNKRSVRTASQQQVRQKVYTGSSQAWRKFEPFLNGIFDGLEA